jgi:hypothetical protein
VKGERAVVVGSIVVAIVLLLVVIGVLALAAWLHPIRAS